MSVELGPTLGDRFHCLERLKADNGIESWVAEDLQRKARAFVKFAPAGQLGLTNRLRIAHESQILQELDSSSVPKLLAFGEANGLVYLATEFVPGEDLESLLSQGPLELRSALSIALSLLESLSQVHHRSILHRDIKPSNIKIPSPHQATLVDFGLSKSTDSQTLTSGKVTGSLLYMAPEQLGLISREMSPATDLYSLGVVLYECLSGAAPFSSDNLTELLRKHLTEVPDPISQSRPEVPRSLERIVAKMLKKEPQERYATADEALLDLKSVLAQIEGQKEVAAAPTSLDFRHMHAPLIGRKAEQAKLEEALLETVAGRSYPVEIEGPAGTGKSRLLDQLVLQAVKRDFLVYRGRAQAEQSSGPFSLLSGIVDTIAFDLSENPDKCERVRAELEDHASTLVASFPSLDFLQPSGANDPETPWLEAQTLRALRSLFLSISDPEQPVLILMDDLQWADSSTRKFLPLWESELEQMEDCHCLIVVGRRHLEEETQSSRSCRVKVSLGPFEQTDVQELFSNFDTNLGLAELSIIQQLTEGNPLMVVETLRELSAQKLQGKELGQGLAQLSQRGLFASRISRVSDDTQHFLRLASHIGHSFQPLGLAQAAGMKHHSIFQCLSEARAESILWEDAASGKFYFLHDRIRQYLAHSLELEEKATLHTRYAEFLEEEAPESHYELAYHLHQAGEHDRASGHALKAARLARRRNALETASFYFDIALRGPNLDSPEHLREELADCYMLMGDYPPALELYQSARKELNTPLDRARLLGKLGELHQKMGQVGEASQSILEAIRLLGGGVPERALGRRVETGWRVLREFLSPSEKRVSESQAENAKSRLLAHLYSRLSYVWFWTHGQADLLFIHLRHLHEAAKHPKSPELAQAFASHAIACVGAHQHDRAHRFAKLSLDLRQQLGDTWGEAHAYNTLGIVLYAASRIEECIEVLERAESLLDAAGDLWELAVCRYNLALCHYRKGNLNRAREPAKRAYAVGLECGDVQASGVSLGVLVRCAPLEITEDQLEKELSASDLDAATKAWLLEAKGIRLLALGKAKDAVKELEHSWSISRELGRRTEYVASSPCWLATAYRKELESLAPFATEERRRILENLGRTVKNARSWGKSFRNNLSHALREEAYWHAFCGRGKKSLESLQQSLEIAEELSFAQELALTTKAQLRLQSVLAIQPEQIGRFAQPMVNYSRLLDHGTPQSVSQAERFQQVLAVAARLNTADEYQVVYDIMLESAKALFRTEDCLVLELQGDDILTVSGEGQIVSHSLVRHAFEVGIPATSVDDLPLTQSLMMARIRSALCIPFGSYESAVCCIQISYNLVEQIFAEDELRVASYLSSLGTAALDSVASREAVKEAEELEQYRRKQFELLEARKEGLLQSLGIASHDLKNLIFMVDCISRGLSDANEPEDLEKAQGFLQLVCRKADWMVRIYLDITQAQQTGSLPCQSAPFELRELAQDVTEFMNQSLSLEGREARVEFAGEQVLVFGDREKLWQAVANLVGNALDHTPPDTSINVKVAKDLQGGFLSVIDRGPGIPSEILETIFDPFVQAKTGGKGTGLGLWITKLIVESSGGSIELDSQLGAGSTFRIRLPAASGH